MLAVVAAFDRVAKPAANNLQQRRDGVVCSSAAAEAELIAVQLAVDDVEQQRPYTSFKQPCKHRCDLDIAVVVIIVRISAFVDRDGGCRFEHRGEDAGAVGCAIYPC